MGLGIGPISRLRTTSLYALLNKCDLVCYYHFRDDEALAKLKFWLNHIDDSNGQSIWRAPSSVRVVYSDTTDTGYGGCVHDNCITHGQWDESDGRESFTWRELKAVLLVLAANNNVKWLTDNKNVAHILTVGSTSTRGYSVKKT